MSENKLYFFKDKKTGKKRNTGVLAKSASAAKKKLKRPSADNAVVYKVRQMNSSEKKAAKRGDWVRGRADGSSPNSDSKRGYGPKRSSKKKTKKKK